MARITLPYSEIPIAPSPPFPNGQVVLRPLMVALLTAANGNTFRCVAWADSGADCCVFPLSFATAMGLNPLDMRQNLTGGVGSSGNATYYDDLTIDLGEGLRFQTYAAFTSGLEAQGLGLLGQRGFFENYSVVFDHRNRQFHIDT